jgi:hypothetical protein
VERAVRQRLDLLDSTAADEKDLTPDEVRDMPRRAAEFLARHPRDYFARSLYIDFTGALAGDVLPFLELQVQLDPAPALTAMEYAEGLRSVGRLDEDRRVIDDAERRHPGLSVIAYARGQEALADHRWRDAVPPLLRALQSDPGNVDIHAALLAAYQEGGDDAGFEKEVAALTQGTVPAARARALLSSR